MRRPFGIIVVVATIVAVPTVTSRGQQPAPPAAGNHTRESSTSSPADVEAQYAAVLAVMKLPGASGVLVTEIEAESAAGAAGLRAGDIIMKLNDREARDLPSLRQVVSDLLGTTTRGIKDKVPLVVARAVAPQAGAGRGAASVETVTLQMTREPLGIRAIEVAAGVPAKLNPPPSRRGTITMAWDDLRRQQGGGDTGATSYFRTHEVGGQWIGWEARSFEPVADDALSAKVEVTRISAQRGDISVSATDAVTFRLRTGDYKTTHAFFLESADALANDGYAPVTAKAIRHGANIAVESHTAYPTRIEDASLTLVCPDDALLPAALPLVAAAMPQQADAVLALHDMSARDFVSRPGYVLATRGKQPLPGDDPNISAPPPDAGGPKAWRVDLMHCGTVLESYWLSDQRLLLRIDTFSGTTLVTRRVANENEARVPAVERHAK